MIESILSNIVQADEFDERSVWEAIKNNPELLNTNNWQAMDDWKNKQQGENWNRTIYLLKQVAKISKIQDQNKKLENAIADMRNASRIHVNVAVDFLETNALPSAIKEYLHALQLDIKIMDAARVEDLLIRLINLIPYYDLISAHAIADKLIGNAFALEALRSTTINQLMLQLYKGILRIYLNNQPLNLQALLFLLQHAKGFAFGAMLKLPTEFPDPRSYGAHLLTVIQEIEHQHQPTEITEEILAIDEEILMASYLAEKEKQVETNSGARISNLRIDFDRWLQHYKLEGIEDGKYPLLTLIDIQAAIGKDTVLYIQFMAGDAMGNAANYILLITKEDFQALYTVDPTIPSGDVEFSSEGMVTHTSLHAFSVPDVRKEIQETPPDNEACTEKGLQLLARDAEMLLVPVVSYLEKLRLAGKTHIMIQPHGAYHYYPFHLLPYKDGLLGDKWSITSLPNLHLLMANTDHSPSNTPLDDIASFGLGYSQASELNLPPLTNAIAEANKIASLFNCKALTDENGTANTANFMKAFNSAKRIHLSAHGIHNVSAPAFQCLFLMPSADSNGSLFAWELMSLKGRNVDLLTMSACQTALGRFDVQDNLRGLPAAFLKAGVSTIIGTLWEAETLSCETFFVRLYTAIQEGRGKKESFQIAQKHTRSLHPEYRDWGNFFYLGAVD